MKQIKVAINYFCAQRLMQDLPEKPEFRLFPRFSVKWIKHKTQIRASGGKTKRFRLIHSIAQCKNVLEGPDRSFYAQAYEKHAATLSKPAVKTPTEILARAYALGQEFGERVAKEYNPSKGYIPSASATYSIKRSQGGKRGVLYKNNRKPFSTFRAEPTVLFIHGEPGCGKSHIVNELVRNLCEREEVPFDDSVYVRSCNTSHWDGYRGQLITVLDDWAQDCGSNKDVAELVGLVTEQAYPLSMADLRDKGTTFTSRYIILCSNAQNPKYNVPLIKMNGQLLIRDPRAVYRRLHHKLWVEDARDNNVIHVSDDYHTPNHMNDGQFPLPGSVRAQPRFFFLKNLSEKLFQDSMKRTCSILKTIPEYRFDYPWTQTIFNIDKSFFVDAKPFGVQCKLKKENILEFPIAPPSDIPKVRVSAVSKPLGTRMVTMGDSELHVLKPLQVAMHKALGTYKKFRATHGDDLQGVFDTLGPLRDDCVILSGDYEAATDGMNMDLSNSILNGILSKIDHQPTKQWAVYENGCHIVEYPEWTGIKPVTQTTGQLMGSLLSFPLLCLANDLITSLAGIENKVINGDDLLAHCTPFQVQEWKRIGTDCGMKPSVGKNYVSRTFGTFNSQLMVYGRLCHYTNLKLVSRKEYFGNCAKMAQLCGISKKLMVRRSKHLLVQSPQSLDVSIEKGGLGYNTTKESCSRLDKLCYMAGLIKNIRFRFDGCGLPRGYKWLVYPTWGDSVTELSIACRDNVTVAKLDLVTSDKTSRRNSTVLHNLTMAEIAAVKRRVQSNEHFREIVNSVDLVDLPNLSLVNYQICVVRNDLAEKTFNARLMDYVKRCVPGSISNQ